MPMPIELRGTCKVAIGRRFSVIRSTGHEFTPEEYSLQAALAPGLGTLRPRHEPLLTNRARTWAKWRERLVGAALLLAVAATSALAIMAWLAYSSVA